MCVRMYLPTPKYEQDVAQGQFLSKILNSVVFLLLDLLPYQAKEHSLSYYLPITGGRIVGFVLFIRELVLCEIQTALSRF